METHHRRKILALREQMWKEIDAILSKAEQKLSEIINETQQVHRPRIGMKYPRMKLNDVRKRTFGVRISYPEREFLEEEARKRNTTITVLIREGYLCKVKNVKLFEKIPPEEKREK